MRKEGKEGKRERIRMVYFARSLGPFKKRLAYNTLQEKKYIIHNR